MFNYTARVRHCPPLLFAYIYRLRTTHVGGKSFDFVFSSLPRFGTWDVVLQRDELCLDIVSGISLLLIVGG